MRPGPIHRCPYLVWAGLRAPAHHHRRSLPKTGSGLGAGSDRGDAGRCELGCHPLGLHGAGPDALRAGLAPLGVDEVRIDWRWTPAWRPDDMTDSGREQLRAIGFAV